MNSRPPLNRPASLHDLFAAFTLLGLQGFGGALAVAQRVLCERRRWVSHEQFVALLAVAQVLPGPSTCNLALMIGDRFFGWRGALSALAGLMTAPFVVLLVVLALYAQFATVPAVAGAVRGMGVAAAGLLLATGLKLLPTLAGNTLRWPACLVIGGAVFAAIALFGLPLVGVLLVGGSLACTLAWWRTGAA